MANATAIILTAEDRTKAAFASAKANLAGIKSAASGLNAALGAVGLAASVGGLATYVKGTIDAADAMRDMAIRTGTSVEALARYQLAAKQAGTDLESLSQSMGRLSVFMAKNADEAQRLGLTASDPVEAFAQLADVIAKVEDPAQRNALAMKVLGKSYAEVMPLLAQGGAALREQAAAAGPYAERMAKLAVAADEFNDSLAAIGQSAQSALLPLVQSFTDSANAAVQAAEGLEGMDAALAGLGQFGTVGQTIAVTWANVAYVFDQVGTEIGGIAAQLAALSRFDFEQAKFIGTAMKRDAAVARQELDALEKRILGVGGKLHTLTSPKIRPKKPFDTAALFPSSSARTKAKKSDLDVIDPFASARRAAEEAETKRMVAAQAAEYDALAEMRDYQIEQDEKAAATMGRLRDEYLALVDPVHQYLVKLEEIQALQDAGALNSDQALAAREKIEEQIEALNRGTEAIKEQDDVARQLGLTFSSAFEDAIVAGKDFQDILQGIADDILRLFIRKAVTEPIAAGLGDIYKGFDLGAIFGGGKALGGPVSSGRAYLVGERGPELFMPPTSGNIVPNNQLGGGRAVVINMHVSAQDAGSFRKSMGQIKADLAFAVNSAGRNM